jgi:hypothetical protein
MGRGTEDHGVEHNDGGKNEKKKKQNNVGYMSILLLRLLMILQVPNENKILLANHQLNEQIGVLQSRWICPLDGRRPCGLTICFVKPGGDGAHVPLTPKRLKSWAAACVCSQCPADHLLIAFYS